MCMRHLDYIAMLIVAVLLSGCNGDIFLDEPDIPISTEVTIEGNGGTAEFTIPTKGLQNISLNYFSSRQDCTYYNSKGDIIDSSSPASEVSLIVCENSLRRFEIRKDGSRLVLESISNTSHYESHEEVVLEYSYGNRFINVVILPGEPMKLESVHYNSELRVTDDAMTKVFRMGFENTSTSDLTYLEYPYLNRYPYVLVEPMINTTDAWVKDIPVSMDVPIYKNGEWVMVQQSGIRPGFEYIYPGPDYLTSVEVTVPAQSNGYVITEMKYACADVSGTMYFLNETLGHRVPINFNMSSYYPVSYEIRIETTD